MRKSILHSRYLRADGDPTEGGAGGGGGGASKPDENGFPADKPLAEMTIEQQAAYWKHQSRKHEQRAEAHKDYDAVKTELDALKAAHQTDAEKAVEQAKTEAKQAGKAEATAEFAPKLVSAELKAALAGKLPADKIAGHVAFLDHTKFLTDSGEVDTDKVKQYAAGLAPAGGWPDMGQGNRGKGDAAAKGVAAGADMYAASRGKKTA